MKTILLPLSVFAFLVIGCGSPDVKSPNDTESTTEPLVVVETTLKEKQDKAAFVVDSYEDSMEIPHSKISVDYNDSRVFLAEIPGIAEIQQGGNEEMEIPKDAIASCGCWYAGGGDYYYIAPSATGITIFHGWLDEMQEDDGYHWEEMISVD